MRLILAFEGTIPAVEPGYRSGANVQSHTVLAGLSLTRAEVCRVASRASSAGYLSGLVVESPKTVGHTIV